MTVQEFCSLHPLLYHMATVDSLAQIQRHGLLSTASILTLLDVGGRQHHELFSCRRPGPVPLDHPQHGKFTLRDQIPLRDIVLANCLDDMSTREWYEMLNSRVFMWASKERVERLLGAKAYRSHDHLLLTINPKLLLQAHAGDVSVSEINSGATLFKPVRRGRHTFVPLEDYRVGRPKKPIVEITVAGGVPNMAQFIVSSEIRRAS
jgi:hypothetical protein